MKKLLALLLALTMVFCLAACGESNNADPSETQETTEATEATDEQTEPPTDPETEPGTEPSTEPSTDSQANIPAFDAVAAAPVFGTWSTELVFDSAAMGLNGFEGEMKFAVVFDFNEDGTYALNVDKEKTDASMETFSEALRTYMIDMFYAEFEKENKSKDEANAQMQSEYGMTIEEYCEAAADSTMSSASSMYAGLQANGLYSVEGTAIYTDDGESYTFEIEGDTMTFVDSTGAEEMAAMGMKLPMVLERVQ